ncbi:unnamed protein product [Penicillium nalgiovense]|nr:unnamed protein product [Penicillium nalgiovense]
MHLKPYTSVGFLFFFFFSLDAISICRLISVELAALYHFYTQCKGLHFMVGIWCFELSLIFNVGLNLDFVCRFSFSTL